LQVRFRGLSDDGDDNDDDDESMIDSLNLDEAVVLATPETTERSFIQRRGRRSTGG